MNIYSAINHGAKILKDNFIHTPFLDSELLMAKAIMRSREYIILNCNNEINEKDFNIFNILIKKRSLGKPVAQLTNKKLFWNSEFYVTNDTLIPRPETELLIEKVLKLTEFKTNLKILDIGIGSGCILLSILKERKDFYGTGIDISQKCLKISRINAINFKVNSRLKLYKTDVDKFNLGKYDVIVSNPPYIKTTTLKYLEKDVVEFEPKGALDGGLDGLSAIRKVIKKSSELIKKNGKFILEIGFDQKNKVINLLKKEGFYIINTEKDLASNDRCVICRKI